MTSRRLSRADWLAVAWEALAEQGIEGLAVEPLAARLGATKGSFYWHFSDRSALLDAVLADWMQRATQAVIDDVEQEPDGERLAVLLDRAMGERDVKSRGEWAILAAAGHRQVAPVVAQVHEARIDYLQRLFRARGLSADRAQARARIFLAAYLGGMQLELTGAGDGDIGPAAYRAELLRMITEGD